MTKTELSSVEKEQGQIKKLREFFVEHLPVFSREKLEGKTLEELLTIYRKLTNAEPTPAGFIDWTRELDRESAEELEGRFQETLEKDNKVAEMWKKFLYLKLPREIIIKQEKEIEKRVEKELEKNPDKKITQEDYEIPLNQLQLIHEKRKDNKMILGFHVANNNYEQSGKIPVSHKESITVSGGQEIHVRRGNSHYSIKPTVYKDVFRRGSKVFLYLVEGSESDFGFLNQEYREQHIDKGWVTTARELPVIFKIELTPQLERELGLSRV